MTDPSPLKPEPNGESHSPRKTALSSAPSPGATDVLETISSQEGLLPYSDEEIVELLRGADLLRELNTKESSRLFPQLGDRKGVARMLDLLEMYYEVDDELASRRRCLLDRYFVYRASEPLHAGALLSRLRDTNPELPALAVERIGKGDNAALVLRSGEHFAGIVDEELDGEECDQRDGPTVSVGGLVNAVNFLLEKVKVRDRLVALRTDGTREVYLAVAVTAAVTLCQADLLEEEDPGAVMELAGW